MSRLHLRFARVASLTHSPARFDSLSPLALDNTLAAGFSNGFELHSVDCLMRLRCFPIGEDRYDRWQNDRVNSYPVTHFCWHQ